MHGITKSRRRPVHLDLRRIRFPINALASIAHRVTGVLMFLATPFCIALLDLSLSGPDGFAAARYWLGSGWAALLLFPLALGLVYHLLAGLRIIAIDLDCGVERAHFRKSAWGVVIAAPTITLIVWALS